MAEPALTGWGDGDAPPQSAISRAAGRFSRRWSFVVLALFLLAAGWALQKMWMSPPPPVRGVAPGEFEPCEALLLAWHDSLTGPQSRVLTEVIDSVLPHVKVCLLVPDRSQQEAAQAVLQEARVPASAVNFVQAPLAIPWTRDYGGLVTRSPTGEYEVLDFVYAQRFRNPEADRRKEDRVPQTVAAALGLRSVNVPLAIDGGNLLCNGAGLCLTSEMTLADNPDYSRAQVSEILRQYVGAEQVVFLEPLEAERTGHVDVFCTFTSPDTVVISQCDEKSDPVNFQILERNAQRLTELKTSRGYLEVVRIPVPRVVRDGRWWTYTNVVYANGVVLVPIYSGAAPGLNEQALETYRRLLPDWKVVGINATPLTEVGGALHCATLNIARIEATP